MALVSHVEVVKGLARPCELRVHHEKVPLPTRRGRGCGSLLLDATRPLLGAHVLLLHLWSRGICVPEMGVVLVWSAQGDVGQVGLGHAQNRQNGLAGSPPHSPARESARDGLSLFQRFLGGLGALRRGLRRSGGTVDALVGIVRATDGVVTVSLPHLVGMVADEVVELATRCGDAWKPWMTRWTRCLRVLVAEGIGPGLHHG